MDWLFYEIEESSVLYLSIKHWIPPLITIIIGGLFASILYPRWQDRFLKRKAREERRLQLSEEILAKITVYIDYWRRVMQLAEHEVNFRSMQQSEKSSKKKRQYSSKIEEIEKAKLEAVSNRRSIRDELMERLNRYKVYCTKQELSSIQEFIIWDEAQSIKTLDELPSIKEWREWESRVQNILSSAT